MISDYQADASRYDTIPYRRAGRSGVLLPAISLGLWQNFGNTTTPDGQRNIVRHAFDHGITHFDLANNYGPPYGSAETNFGRILAHDLAPYRDELFISSKAGYHMWPGPYGEWPSRKNLIASLDQSLARLGLDYVDLFYAHRPDPRIPIDETMGALATIVEQGKALYVGISNYRPDQTREAAAALASFGHRLLIHQPRYSMFDRHVEHGLLTALDEIGAGCIVFSPLAQGLLTERYLGGSIPSDSRAALQGFPDPNRDAAYLERARALAAIAAERGQTLAQLALSWVLRHDGITSALIGASSVQQLSQNLEAVTAPPLTDEELTKIDQWAIDGTGRDR